MRTESTTSRPRLLFFYSPRDGRARRVEGFLAQVLQRRANHETFDLQRIDTSEHPELAERFRVGAAPSLIVVQDKRLRGRLDKPTGCVDIHDFLEPWLH